MGGAMDVVNSTFDLLSDVTGIGRQDNSDMQQMLRAERKAQEAELKDREHKERKHQRDNVTEARERQRRRLTEEKPYGQTTLLHGGAGLTEDAAVAKTKLKQKLGE